MGKTQLEVTVMRTAGKWSKSMTGYSRTIRQWVAAALVGEKGSVTIVLADDATLRRLNREYRGKDKPTNVLSFEGDHGNLGDIVLAYETVKREAREEKKSFTRHLAHLVVHGCLHLLGHDHGRAQAAKRMESLEKKILARFGYPDPYNAV